MEWRELLLPLVLIFFLFAGVVMLDSPTGSVVSEYRFFERRMGVFFGDFFAEFFEIDGLDFSRIRVGVQCARLARDVLDEISEVKPDGLAGFESNGEYRFASYAFSYPQTLGTVELARGSFNGEDDPDAARIHLSLSKNVRELYGLGTKSVDVD